VWVNAVATEGMLGGGLYSITALRKTEAEVCSAT